MVKRSRLRIDRRGKGRLLFVLALTVILLLMGHSFFNSFQGNDKPVVQEENRIFQDSLLNDRGIIYDRNFKKLAVTKDKVSVYVNVRDIEKHEVVERLAPVLKAQPEMLMQTIQDAQFKAWLARNISREEEKKVIAMGIPGLFSFWEKVRYYPQQKTAAHLIGYVGKSTGLSGVEYFYNNLLNHHGEDLAVLVGDEVDNPKGVKKSITLTIDLHLQQVVESILQEFAVIQPEGKYTALFIEIDTGAIIAAGHYPSFNPNSFNEEDPDALEKILVDRDVLNNLLVTPISIPYQMKKMMWDVSVQSGLDGDEEHRIPWCLLHEEKSDISQQKFIRNFKLTEPVKVDWIKQLDENRLSLIKKHGIAGKFEYEYIPEVTTPLHLVQVLAAILTGEIPSLHVVNIVTDKDGRSFKTRAKKNRQILSLQQTKEARKLMQAFSVKERGLYSTFEIKSAGVEKIGKYNSFERNRLYASWYPKEKPRLMFFVWADLPSVFVTSKKMKNLDMASVVSKKMMSMITRQEVARSLEGSVELEEDDSETFVEKRTIGPGFFSTDRTLHPVSVRMPDVRKLNLRKALQQLEGLNLDIRIQGTGKVVEQNPPSGTKMKQGDVCTLILQSY